MTQVVLNYVTNGNDDDDYYQLQVMDDTGSTYWNFNDIEGMTEEDVVQEFGQAMNMGLMYFRSAVARYVDVGPNIDLFMQTAFTEAGSFTWGDATFLAADEGVDVLADCIEALGAFLLDLFAV